MQFIFASYSSNDNLRSNEPSCSISKGPGYAFFRLRANEKLPERPNAKYVFNRPVFSVLGGDALQTAASIRDEELSRELDRLREHLSCV